MTRLWRYLILLGGLLGLGGFFAPFIEYRAPDGSLDGASAYAIVTGHHDASGLMSKAQQLGLVSAEEATRATDLIAQGAQAYKSAMAAIYAPAALLLLLGLVAFARRRLARIDGVLAVIAGCAAGLAYVMLYTPPAPARTTGQLGLGIYALTVGGLLGLLGGVGALLLPEKRA